MADRDIRIIEYSADPVEVVEAVLGDDLVPWQKDFVRLYFGHEVDDAS